MLDAMRGYKILVPLITLPRHPRSSEQLPADGLEMREVAGKNGEMERVNEQVGG
jgi:hypothetical protein